MAKPSNIDYLLVGARRLLNRPEVQASDLVSSVIKDASEFIKELTQNGQPEEVILVTAMEGVEEIIEGLEDLPVETQEDYQAKEVALANLRQFRQAARSKMR